MPQRGGVLRRADLHLHDPRRRLHAQLPVLCRRSRRARMRPIRPSRHVWRPPPRHSISPTSSSPRSRATIWPTGVRSSSSPRSKPCAACPRSRSSCWCPTSQATPSRSRRSSPRRPDVLGHNVETVPRLYPRVRPGAGYARSLGVLEAASAAGIHTKSGLMLGLGESLHEVVEVLADLRAVGCRAVTLGQYLESVTGAPAGGRVPAAACVRRPGAPGGGDGIRPSGLGPAGAELVSRRGALGPPRRSAVIVQIRTYTLPDDLSYTRDHAWVRVEGARLRVGITDVMQQLAGAITFIRLPREGKALEAGKTLASLQSGKWAGKVVTPSPALVVEVNRGLTTDPVAAQQRPVRPGVDRGARAGRSGRDARRPAAWRRRRTLAARRTRSAWRAVVAPQSGLGVGPGRACSCWDSCGRCTASG